ncbi:DUF3331 domain-containing protein [Paraburkholderia gardini]|uniref:DUF3331 domain-containing protein n=1 Tax=Paraburkholderia gardini TaxID=2823469 RepID=A0ABN7QQL3_9BURK|nr:DUF3331 domain-containing protein [Paraburkholderia gardini]CAG4901703.1 hypothetical protein R69919_02869 [Paraburkholderia gardini]CAG4909596.1 hypothetical protein R54767_03615 [Paraburkholderia gardini]
MNIQDFPSQNDPRTRISPCRGMPAGTWERDPWAQMLSLLEALCAAPVDESRSGRRTREPDARYRARAPRRDQTSCRDTEPPVITLLERLSTTAVVLCWRSTTCHYGDQVWIQGVARSSGRCAVSGMAIRRGDAVYRPGSRGRRVPVNVGAMIHASAFA